MGWGANDGDHGSASGQPGPSEVSTSASGVGFGNDQILFRAADRLQGGGSHITIVSRRRTAVRCFPESLLRAGVFITMNRSGAQGSRLIRGPLHAALAGPLGDIRQQYLGLMRWCRLTGAASARSSFKLLPGGWRGAVSPSFRARAACNQALQATAGEPVLACPSLGASIALLSRCAPAALELGRYMSPPRGSVGDIPQRPHPSMPGRQGQGAASEMAVIRPRRSAGSASAWRLR